MYKSYSTKKSEYTNLNKTSIIFKPKLCANKTTHAISANDMHPIMLSSTTKVSVHEAKHPWSHACQVLLTDIPKSTKTTLQNRYTGEEKNSSWSNSPSSSPLYLEPHLWNQWFVHPSPMQPIVTKEVSSVHWCQFQCLSSAVHYWLVFLELLELWVQSS